MSLISEDALMHSKKIFVHGKAAREFAETLAAAIPHFHCKVRVIDADTFPFEDASPAATEKLIFYSYDGGGSQLADKSDCMIGADHWRVGMLEKIGGAWTARREFISIQRLERAKA